ncbi:MAG: hypothetical protein INF91_00295, partial [Alphaproteobacteria bacterium]|nr:hypothetical protein [Alphaproteobacteria bacterium]
RGRRTAELKKIEAAASAIRDIKTEVAKRPDPKPTGQALPETTNPKGKSLADLTAAYRAAKSKKQAAKFAAEILAKQKATPAAYDDAAARSMTVAKDIPPMRKEQLETELVRAMDNGDSQRVNDILFEAWRRGRNKTLKDAGQPVIYPKVRNSLVNSAIARHIAQSEGEFIDDGIVPSAPATVREFQSYMEHRDPETRIVMRELVYRAMNLMGKTTRDALANSNLMTVGDVYRLANMPQPVNSAGVFTDFRNPAFNKLRADMRKMAVGLTKGVSNPFDAMHEVYHLALRTGVFGEDDMRVIRDQFTEAARRGEKVATSRLATYAPGKTIDELSPSELAMVAEEWFAESGALHTIGKVAKGDMFAIREAGDMSALTMKSRLMTMAEQLIDAVAYLVNGLVGRQDIKQMFRRVDAFGDIFERRQMRFLREGSTPGGVAPEYAAAHYAQAWASMPEARKRAIFRFMGDGLGIARGSRDIKDINYFYHGTPNGERLTDANASLMPGRGDWGRGVYLTADPQVATQVYAGRPTVDAMRRRVWDLSADGKIKAEDVQQVLSMVESLGKLRRSISKTANEAYYLQLGLRGDNPDNLRSLNIQTERETDLISRVENMRAYEAEMIEELAREIEFAQNALRAAMKKPVDSGVLATDGIRNFSRGIRTFNAVTLLGFTTLSSLPDLVLPIIRSGSFKTYAKAMKQFARDPDYREAIRNTGVAIESIVHQRMAGLFASDISGKLGQFNNAFFNATGLTPWTDMNRKIAGAVGFEMFKAEISRALANRIGDGTDLAAQNKTYRLAMRRLNRYGLGDYVARGETLDADALERPEVKRAVVQFANDTIFAPSPDDMPLWTQTPVGAIIWQLKSFPLMMTRFAGEMVSDIKAGDWKRPGMFLAIGPAFGAASLALKDVVQMRGGEDGDEGELRARNWKKFLGYDEKAHGDENDFLGWYAEGMLAMGGLGILADVLHSTAADVDNGAYGSQRVMSTFFGPSVGTFGSAVTVAGGLKDGLTGATPDSNAKERSAVREAVRRIPVVGGIGGVREGIVDAAFEDTSNSGAGGGDGFDFGGGGDGGFDFGDDPSVAPADDLSGFGDELAPQSTESF